MLSKTLSAAVLVTTLAFPAAAAGVFYECDLNADRAMGWVSPKMGIVFDGKGGATVLDGVILQFVGDPMPVRARKRGDTVRLTWTISAAEDVKKHTIAMFSYVAKLNLKTNAISVVARPVGYPQQFSAKGSCVIRKNAKGFKRR